MASRRTRDTDVLQAEYVDTFNRYVRLPDGSKELKKLSEELRELESILTIRFLFANGYTLKKDDTSEFSIIVKDGQ